MEIGKIQVYTGDGKGKTLGNTNEQIFKQTSN